MTYTQLRFDDGASYERMMGVWSRMVGEEFLGWLAPEPGLRWLDVGCGNGAFTELLVERCAAAAVLGLDPSEAQLEFARARHRVGVAEFRQGGATSLPLPDDSFDAAVMALVLFFVPEPARGVAEMVRAVRPGGTVSAYVWDLLAPGGFPGGPMQEEMGALGLPPVRPPSPEASRMDVLRALWTDAGLIDIRTRAITVVRSFADFDDYWATVQIALAMSPATSQIDPAIIASLRSRLRDRLTPDADGRITYTSRANAVAGRVA